jgi:hypothetical protein
MVVIETTTSEIQENIFPLVYMSTDHVNLILHYKSGGDLKNSYHLPWFQT